MPLKFKHILVPLMQVEMEALVIQTECSLTLAQAVRKFGHTLQVEQVLLSTMVIYQLDNQLAQVMMLHLVKLLQQNLLDQCVVEIYLKPKPQKHYQKVMQFILMVLVEAHQQFQKLMQIIVPRCQHLVWQEQTQMLMPMLIFKLQVN